MPRDSDSVRLLGQAWQYFAAGDLAAALRSAQAATACAPEHAGAQAALGFFNLQSGDAEEAMRLLADATRRSPTHAPSHWYLGYVHQHRGEPALALAAFREACRLDPGLDEAAFALAWALVDAGEYDEAMPWALRATATAGPGSRGARLLLVGWIQQQRQQFDEAVAAYREALRTVAPGASEVPRLWLQLSQCLRRLGETDEAALTLERGLLARPSDPELLLEAAWQARNRGDPGAAAVTAKNLVESNPELAAGWNLLGVLQQEQGDLKAADASFATAHERNPLDADSLLRRAGIQREWGRYEGARRLLDRLLDAAPGHEGGQELMIQVLLDLGDVHEARRRLVMRLRCGGASADLWRLLGVAQAHRGRAIAARRSVARALQVEPGNVEALRMSGWLALEERDMSAALDAVRRLLNSRPHDAAANAQAAFVFGEAQLLPEAQAAAERAVVEGPQHAEAWRALSRVRYLQRRMEEAQFAIDESLRLAPGRVDSLRQLGWVLIGRGRYGDAQLAFLRAIESEPEHRFARLELADARGLNGAFTDALKEIDELLRVCPGWPPALLLKARLLAEGPRSTPAAAEALRLCEELLRGADGLDGTTAVLLRLAARNDGTAHKALHGLAPDLLRRGLRNAIAGAVHHHGQEHIAGLIGIAVQQLPEDGWMSTASLYAASLAAATSPADLARQARDWFRGLKIRTGLSPLGLGPRAGQGLRKPRLAYVTSQPHESLMRRVLASHDPRRIDVFLYASSPMRELPAHVQVLPLAPEMLAESCAANAIDVVIDAGGLQPFEGQFGLLQQYARRVAPWQVGWLGSWGPSGGLFDALLTDVYAVPVEHETHYDEEILRLEGGQWCWDPPAASPVVSPAPVIANGSVTFGVVARGLRLNPESQLAFARIVAATPRATIRFIGRVSDDWPQRAAIEARMAAHGVDAGRVRFDPWRTREELMLWFSQVDVVLDTFPGNGGLSLLDALWMGVPVVTRAGDWSGARQACSLLCGLGLGGWVGESTAEFEAIAGGLAADRSALAVYRAALRGRLVAAPLLDGRRIAEQIEVLCESRAAATAAPASQDRKTRVRIHADKALDAWLRAPRTIELADGNSGPRPELSVVVVLFNQAGLSRRTLQALADQRGVTFESIIVDNASSDCTGELLERLTGARVVRNSENRGFLLAAAQGAELARGRYVVFLNSDAILQEGALRAAWTALREDPSIGALGGRIVLTDGGLQEAGNALFCDGSAGGIGRGEDPFGHAARSAHSTDYVSGVLLATPLELWRRLGGFDVAFVPAYYEDTDYCVRVWKAGLRVWYEPAVLVEHLEGGSASGGSVTQLMQRHRVTFLERHGDWLDHRSRPRALPLGGDRWSSWEDRSRRRPRILVLDNEVPHAFKGAGLPRARLLLHALRDWPVTLLPLWIVEDEWHAIYQTLPKTVEVVLGCGLSGLEQFLERRRGVYDVLLVSRPPNMDAIGPLRRRRPDLFAGLRLVYDAEALFALRETAMAAVRGRPLAASAAAVRVTAEVELARGATDVLAVSDRDASYFRSAGLRTHVLSHSIAVRRRVPGPQQRDGLLFIGALHPGTPNEDGLLWFLDEVMPLLQRRLARAPELRIVGLCRSSRVAARAAPHVHILGKQDELEPHYDAARVFIAPARFAGGVPVKVIESAAHGIPVVGSAILVRQLGWRDGVDIQSGRDADTFASGIIRLLEGDALWRDQQESAWGQCARRYDPEAFKRSLFEVLDPDRKISR